VWKIEPGTRFVSHEPPKLEGAGSKWNPIPFTHEETEKEGLVFDHWAWATPAQVTMKMDYYGSPNNEKGALYAGLREKWRALQRNEKWPVAQLSEFMPFVGENVTANRI
jgi:hypothetical protein